MSSFNELRACRNACARRCGSEDKPFVNANGQAGPIARSNAVVGGQWTVRVSIQGLQPGLEMLVQLAKPLQQPGDLVQGPFGDMATLQGFLQKALQLLDFFLPE